MRLLFFGALADIVGKTDLQMDAIQSTDALKKELVSLHPQLANHSFLIAVNKKIEIENTVLKADDVVALLPPFSGG